MESERQLRFMLTLQYTTSEKTIRNIIDTMFSTTFQSISLAKAEYISFKFIIIYSEFR